MTSPAGPQASSQPASGPAAATKATAGIPQQDGAPGADGSATAAAAAAAQPEGSPTQQQQQQQPRGRISDGGSASAEEAARRQKRREAWEREQEGQRRWDLQCRLADISTDVEFLAREVRGLPLVGGMATGWHFWFVASLFCCCRVQVLSDVLFAVERCSCLPWRCSLLHVLGHAVPDVQVFPCAGMLL